MSATQTSAITGSNGALKRGVKGTLNGAAKGVGAKQEKTDYTRWRLANDRGCHIWHYLESDEEVEKWPQSIADKWYLGLETVCFFFPLPCSPSNGRFTGLSKTQS